VNKALASYTACADLPSLSLPPDARSVTLSGLRAARSYVIFVAARNAAGAGDAAVVSTAVTAAASPPSAPVSLAVAAGSDVGGVLQLGWPDDVGGVDLTTVGVNVTLVGPGTTNASAAPYTPECVGDGYRYVAGLPSGVAAGSGEGVQVNLAGLSAGECVAPSSCT
jgi:hypothetical protein